MLLLVFKKMFVKQSIKTMNQEEKLLVSANYSYEKHDAKFNYFRRRMESELI